MKTNLSLLITVALLAGCTSVSKSIPTVKIEKRQPKVVTQTASFKMEASPEETAKICETDAMRKKVIDGNDNNDLVRLMVVQDTEGSSQLLSEVEINCRDYFLRKSLSPSSSSLVRTSSPQVKSQDIIRRSRHTRYTYIVQRGDTVWDIAREHCTSVKDISRLNGLGRGNVIDIGQRLKLPDVECK